MKGFIKDLGLVYGEAWQARKDVKRDLKTSDSMEDRMLNRAALFMWWVLFLSAHFVVIAIPAAVGFTIAGLAGAYG